MKNSSLPGRVWWAVSVPIVCVLFGDQTICVMVCMYLLFPGLAPARQAVDLWPCVLSIGSIVISWPSVTDIGGIRGRGSGAVLLLLYYGRAGSQPMPCMRLSLRAGKRMSLVELCACVGGGGDWQVDPIVCLDPTLWAATTLTYSWPSVVCVTIVMCVWPPTPIPGRRRPSLCLLTFFLETALWWWRGSLLIQWVSILLLPGRKIVIFGRVFIIHPWKLCQEEAIYCWWP